MANDNGSTPGDGQSSPFGDGRGGIGGNMAGGNDFTQNPTGGIGKSGGNDFVVNPTGNGPKGNAQPAASQPAQPKGNLPDLNAQTQARTLSPVDDATPSTSSGPRANLLGAGTIGDGRKPYTLRG